MTVKRLFKAKNTGLTPIYISGFEIEGQPCEGYGFKVLNCEPFTIEPSQSVDVDIAFTPDFTLSKVTRTLSLFTSLSPDKRRLNFTLQATVPGHMLFVCASVLPRPTWEPYLFYIINSFMFFILICVLVTAVMEAERILKITVGIPMHARTHLLDLRRVAAEVDHDLRHRLVNGNGHLDEDGKSQMPAATTTPKPIEKKLLLSRLASRSISLVVLPFQFCFGLLRTSASFIKSSVLSFHLRRSRVSDTKDEDGDGDADDIEEDDDEDEEVDEDDDAIDDGDDEGEEEAVTENRTNSFENKTSSSCVTVAASSSSTTSQGRQHRSRKRGRQNHFNWRQKSGGEFLAGTGSDDHCDSSSTCTESSVVEEDSVGNPQRNAASQRNRKLNGQKSSLAKENGNNVSSNTSTATTNANNIAKTNSSNIQQNIVNNNNNSKKEKANKKSAPANPVSCASSKPVAEEPKPAPKSSPVEPSKKTPPPTSTAVAATAVKAKPTAPTTAPLSQTNSSSSININSGHQQSQATVAVAKKAPVKQQAKVKPNEKPPRLVLKSLSEPEDRIENGLISASPGTPGPGIGGGLSYGIPSPPPLTEVSKLKTKVTPVGKILPEIKKPENLGAQFGPVGAKPPALAAAAARKSTWCDSPAEPRPVLSSSSVIGNGSGVGRIDSGGMYSNSVSAEILSPPPPIPTPADLDMGMRYQQPQQQQQQRMLNMDDISGGGLGLGSGLVDPGNRHCRPANNNGSPTHSTLMQTLQLERRQRTEEFFSQQQQPDWPGFGSQLTTTTPESFLENLWDPPQTDSSLSLASGRSGLSSNWGTFSQIWPSSLWGNPIGFGSGISSPSPIEPLPTYNSRLSGLQQDSTPGSDFSSLAAVWGESPKRQPPNQPQQQQQPQPQTGFHQPQPGLNSSWSSTLFSGHPHQE